MPDKSKGLPLNKLLGTASLPKKSPPPKPRHVSYADAKRAASKR